MSYRVRFCVYARNTAIRYILCNLFTIVNSYGGDIVSYHYSKTLSEKKYRQGTRTLEASNNPNRLFTYVSYKENM